MPASAGSVAQLGQKVAHSTMCMNVIRIDAQRRFEVMACLFVFVGQEQEIGEIDTSVGVVRVMANSFAEQRARGILVTGREDERAEIVERTKVGRRAPQEFEIVVLRRLEDAQLAKQAGPFVSGADRVGVLFQHAVKLADAGVFGAPEANARSRCAVPGPDRPANQLLRLQDSKNREDEHTLRVGAERRATPRIAQPALLIGGSFFGQSACGRALARCQSACHRGAVS